MKPIYIIDLIAFDGYCVTNACTKAQTLKGGHQNCNTQIFPVVRISGRREMARAQTA